MMKLTLAVLAACAIADAQKPSVIPQDSRVFVADSIGMTVTLGNSGGFLGGLARAYRSVGENEARGFDYYLEAALNAKHVPVRLVSDRAKADYALEATWEHVKSLSIKPSILANWMAPALAQKVTDYDGAAVRLVSLTSGEIVFAYAVDRNNTLHGRQSIAESIAKHLKAAMGERTVTSQIMNALTIPGAR